MTPPNKVFVIGFNKTATTTIHQFFARNGYKSVHWQLPDKRFLALALVTNVLSGRSVLASISEFDVYSDFTFANDELYLEANHFFYELYEAYPSAYFLLNVRDTDSWIESRNNHVGQTPTGRRSFVERVNNAYQTSTEQTEQVWRDHHEGFHQKVREFFAARPRARFKEYRIETDSVEDIIDWLKNDYTLDRDLWVAANVTKQGKRSAP